MRLFCKQKILFAGFELRKTILFRKSGRFTGVKNGEVTVCKWYPVVEAKAAEKSPDRQDWVKV